MSRPPKQIGGARIVRWAGDPTWPVGRRSSSRTGVVALQVVDYGGDDEDGDHVICRLHDDGEVSDDWHGDRANAIRFFDEEVSDLGLTEIQLLPPPWEDVGADAELQARLSALMREELGENGPYAQKLICTATCGGCDSALCEVGSEDWAVVHLTWSRKQLEASRPWVEVFGSWEEVLPVVERHASGEH